LQGQPADYSRGAGFEGRVNPDGFARFFVCGNENASRRSVLERNEKGLSAHPNWLPNAQETDPVS